MADFAVFSKLRGNLEGRILGNCRKKCPTPRVLKCCSPRDVPSSNCAPLAGLGVGVPHSLRGAEKETPPYEGSYFAVFNASGGWDTTHLMDPSSQDKLATS